MILNGRCFGKKIVYDNITSYHLETMKQGQTFGLWTLGGLRIFRLEEIRKNDEVKEDTKRLL